MGKIYTKKGDKGFTHLLSGKKTAKDALKIQTLGSIDELNTTIGLSISFLNNKQLRKELTKIQKDLFLLGGYLAGDKKEEIKILEKRTREIELLIDDLSIKLPKLTSFILPGGAKEASFLHLARAVCRRCERVMVSLLRKERINKDTIAYLNRLSDLLFVMARFINIKAKKKEVVFEK